MALAPLLLLFSRRRFCTVHRSRYIDTTRPRPGSLWSAMACVIMTDKGASSIRDVYARDYDLTAKDGFSLLRSAIRSCLIRI